MPWTLRGTWYEACSCRLVCECNFGPAEPDQGWCSGVLGFAIDSGESNGVDLGGTRMVLHAELPGDFMGGIDKARIYLDEASSQEQRDELVAIFQGQRGGVWEGIAGSIREFLPSRTAKVEVTGGDNPTVRVDGVLDLALQRVKDESGKQAVLTNAPLSAGFAVTTMELATATGGANDDDLRKWQTLGNAAAIPFDWSF